MRAMRRASFTGIRCACALLGVVSLRAQYGEPRVVATVDLPHLKESSGLAASRRYPGVFWTHNDSGGGAWVYAFDRSGKGLGRWRIAGASPRDIEDIAIGSDGKLYVGDIGDNLRKREFITVFRVAEPDPASGGKTTRPPEVFRFTYPDAPHDAEALMVHPRTGDVYIVTKARGNDSDTLVYKAAAPLRSGTLKRVAVLELPQSALTLIVGRVTAGDISPDGTRVMLSDYFRGWEAVLPKGAKDFDAIWKTKWTEVPLGQREQGESVCYRHDGKAILAGSEGKSFPLIEVVRR